MVSIDTATNFESHLTVFDNVECHSPTICLLDHQEIVSSSPVFQSSTCNNGEGAETLFSFELENNEIPPAILNTVDDLLADFGWTDDVTYSGDSMDHFLPFIEDGELLDPKGSFPFPCSTLTNQSVRNHTVPTFCTSSPQSGSSEFQYRSLPGNKRTSPPERHRHLEDCSASSSEDGDSTQRYLNNEDLIHGTPGTRLNLTFEERRLLKAMGVQMPSHLPLTRTEEKALKTVRRKIRNKLSAQASRIRRQHYVSELEHRVQVQEKENSKLRKYVATLENDKRNLMSHIRKLRAHVTRLLSKEDRSTLPLPMYVDTKQTKRYSKTTAQTATAAAGGTSLLLISFLFLAWTAMVPGSHKLSKADGGIGTNTLLNIFPGRSRALLESRPDQVSNMKPPPMDVHPSPGQNGVGSQQTDRGRDELDSPKTSSISAEIVDTVDLLKMQRLSIQPNDSAAQTSAESIPNVIKSFDH